jgi:hypothetical protein
VALGAQEVEDTATGGRAGVSLLTQS